MNTSSKIFGPWFVAFLLLMGANRAGAITIYAVDTSNPQNLLRFDSATPGTIQDSRPITGLEPNETIQGIDYRTVNTGLYALGSTSRLYTINRFSGVATPVSGPGPFTVNGIIGFDHDPTSADFRVVSTTDQNIRLDSGGTVAAAETALVYAAGDPNFGADPNITGAAYTTNVFAARITTLYTIDSALNILATQDPPETGELKTKGALGVDAGFLVGFDIASASGNNTGYATLRVSGTTGLYTINLTTGAATLIGAVGGNPVLVDMTVSLEAQNFVVNNTSHLAFGDCSVSSCNLRQAIQAANAKPGPDFITFNISGSGVQTFNVFSGGLPAITDPVTIDGYTQPGASPNTLAVGNNAVPLIELNGASAGNVVPGGLVIRTSRCTVRGLIINRFTNAGIILQKLAAPAATDTVSNDIEGNFIGTDASGTLALGNGTGVMVSAGATEIGGTTPGTRNLISGNIGSGISFDPLGDASKIYGNYIGTDRNGTVALGNGTSGISIECEGNRIGGPGPGPGNLISGNGDFGLELKGANAINNHIEGNLIGTNATGNAALGNEYGGVLMNTGASFNTVGGAAPAARNVISGNKFYGVFISEGDDNSVLGNFIGTDAAGQTDLGNALVGVVILHASGNVIGGTASGEGNLISGNGSGVNISGLGTTDNRVQGNRIGTDAAGGPLGNNLGIFIGISASDTTVGGPAGAANTIAFNHGVGVRIAITTGNDITGNSIFSNSGLGIDLEGGTEDGFGVTANDSLDADTGPNRLQNYPVLTGITGTGSTRAVQGLLNSAPNTGYNIDFYRNNAVDPSGFGEGQTPIGFLYVQTDPQGHTSFSFPLDGNASGQFITATATDPFGNTSEFSQASSVVPGPPPPTPTPTATPTPVPARLANISTRLRVETGDNVLIGGFIVTGTQPKKIIVRAIGPSLPFGDRLVDPTLELHGPSGLIEANDNWVQSPNQQAIIATTIPPGNDRESAIVATVPANNSAYTAIVRGVNDGTGLGIIEAYDLDSTVDSKLANISTRGLVQTGDNILIAGTIILGQAAQKIIVRAIGPSLSIAGKLDDPTLELRDQNGVLVASNDNWRSTQEAEIIATTIAPPHDFESAIVTTVTANGASYTAIMRGVNTTTGIAVVEIYALQ